jgi:type IV pilus assembly protein PilP
MIRMTGARGLAPAMAAVALLTAGCDDGRTELQSWMEETRRAMPQTQEKVAAPKVFVPFRYSANDGVDPFSQAKLKLEATVVVPGRSNALQPDLRRTREPLESFPLDLVRMVGNLQQGPTNVALLQIESHVYQVRLGNYIGQNFGRITRISEGEVAVKERVQDAAGDWVERDTSLRLQEGTK